MNSQGIQVSMDGKGRATDNAYIEKLWRTVEREYVYLLTPENGWIWEKVLIGSLEDLI
jgi:putative transposase